MNKQLPPSSGNNTDFWMRWATSDNTDGTPDEPPAPTSTKELSTPSQLPVLRVREGLQLPSN